MGAVTEKNVEKLKPPEKGSRILWDREIPGFGVRITANGVKSYILSYRVDGRQTKYQIARTDECSVTKARSEARELREKARAGVDPHVEEAEEKRKRIEAPTVADLAKKYYDDHVMKVNGEDQQRNVRDILKNYVVKKWGDRKLTEVKQSHVKTLHNSLKHKVEINGEMVERGRYRANRVLSTISKMFNYGIDEELCTENPAKGVKKHAEDKRQTWMNEDKLREIDDAITDYGRDAGDLIRLIMLTGYRCKEWKRARKDAFDMDHGTWTKLAHTVKKREWESARLSPVVMEVLRRVMASTPPSEPYLFPGKVDGKPRTTIRRAWVQILRNAGLATETTVIGKRGKPLTFYKPKVRLHDLRHSYCSWLAEHGVPLPVIGKSVGHLDPKTTARYAHIADSSAMNAQDVFSKMITQRVQ